MKNLKTIAAISLAVAGVVGVTVASAQQGPFSPLPSERHAMMSEYFDQADANGDGTLSNDELNGYIAERRAQMRFERMDRDGDGTISPEEFGPGQRDGKPGNRQGAGEGHHSGC